MDEEKQHFLKYDRHNSSVIVHVSQNGTPNSLSKPGHNTYGTYNKLHRTLVSSNETVTLTWENVNVYANPTKRASCFGRNEKVDPKQILKNVYGLVKPSCLVAIIGASGSGKTTLLNTLTSRSNNNVLTTTGDVRVNGVDVGIGIRNISAYVQQDDLFIATMTVKEHLIFRAEMDTKSLKKGRLYSCNYCEKAGKSYREARYRVIGHILKHHRSLDETPYYCSLCMFRCTTSEALKKHVTSYKRHELMSMGGQSDSSKFLVENPSARSIDDGTEFRVLTLREQYSNGAPEEDPLSIIDECLLREFDALDEQMTPSLNQTKPHTQTSSASHGTTENQPFSVQISPEILTQLGLLQPKLASAQGTANQMFQPPPPIQRHVQPPQLPLTQRPVDQQTSNMQFPGNTLPPTSRVWPTSTLTLPLHFNPRPHVPNSSSSTPLMDELSNTVISFPTPEQVAITKKQETPRNTQLNTPKPPSPENIMPQLLGNVPSSPTFSEVGTVKPAKTYPPSMVPKPRGAKPAETHPPTDILKLSGSKPATETRPLAVVPKPSGSKPATETCPPAVVPKPSGSKPATKTRTSTEVPERTESGPEPKRPRIDYTASNALLETLGKITAAIDWNSRAIRNQDKTLSQIVNVLSGLGQSVKRIADDIHNMDPSPRHKENVSPRSPKRKGPKSVVKKR